MIITCHRYKQYEESLVGLNGLMDNWIRALGEVKPKKETEPTSGVEDTPTHTTASKRKSRKEVRVSLKHTSLLHVCSCYQIAPIVVDPVPELVVPVTSTGISLTDFDDMEGVGVPVINATASAATNQVFEELYRGGVLPSVEEVVFTSCVYVSHCRVITPGVRWDGFGSRWSTHSPTIPILCDLIPSA